jgi:endoplasmic reticulum junction formation protein lunapark
MASPEMTSSAAASGTKRKEEEQREGPGILVRMRRALFGGRGDDFEKRLQHLSKEEADLVPRMRRRAHFSRRGIRNLVVFSVLGEVSQFACSLYL